MNRTRSVMLRKTERSYKHIDKLELYLAYCYNKYRADTREHKINKVFLEQQHILALLRENTKLMESML